MNELTPQPPGMPMFNAEMKRTHLASDRVRFVGEPVAVVLAESHTEAVDAAETVWVDVDPLPAVVSVHDALTDQTLLFPEEKACWDWLRSDDSGHLWLQVREERPFDARANPVDRYRVVSPEGE